MIVDRIEYAAAYEAQLPHLEDALRIIRDLPEEPETGRYEFPGGYLMYQTGMTKPAGDAAYETHRAYIDVQILREGRELILWDRAENMTPTAPYDLEKDKQALRGAGSALEMRPGMFCALFPTDAHSACRHEDGAQPGAYRKFVVKLEV